MRLLLTQPALSGTCRKTLQPLAAALAMCALLPAQASQSLRCNGSLVGTNAEIVTLRGVGYLLCDADSMAAHKTDKAEKSDKGGVAR